MKNLKLILSSTLIAGLMMLSVSCVDKKKEDTTDAEVHHEQEMHDEEMHDEEMMDEEMDHDEINHDEMNHDAEM
ncbi:hypothetical protein [Psychroflexus sediminis]|uniref:Pentapeptide MXKDX repeat protein n=1 Tax=Psychroflexus sediminis TaxID=470826 RepID=A0A1G7UG22_9FLAO|nr:hypothetical protein [Psychroflexus sediminis]SDG46019.1 hypothetical protein SAMN04488027_10236 [Psychroflexus sediminis]